MSTDLIFHTLLLVAVLWLRCMFHVLWPCGQPFACSMTPTPPPPRLPTSTFMRGRKRTIDTQSHFCPDQQYKIPAERGGALRDNTSANKDKGASPIFSRRGCWRSLRSTAAVILSPPGRPPEPSAQSSPPHRRRWIREHGV